MMVILTVAGYTPKLDNDNNDDDDDEDMIMNTQVWSL